MMSVKTTLVIILQLVKTVLVHLAVPVMLDFPAMGLSVKVYHSRKVMLFGEGKHPWFLCRLITQVLVVQLPLHYTPY